ncbi:MAG: hypothetical protein ABSE19_05555 [Candidatus Acidiferrum sp.]|jgi:hypothetical protein
MDNKKDVDLLKPLRDKVTKDAKTIVGLMSGNLKPGANPAELEEAIFNYLCDHALPEETAKMAEVLSTLDRKGDD